jgi:hypothetical protein
MPIQMHEVPDTEYRLGKLHALFSTVTQLLSPHSYNNDGKYITYENSLTTPHFL